MIDFLAFATLGLADPDLFAPARSGQALCAQPNVEAKTCAGLITYEWSDDGSVTATNLAAISATPSVIVTFRSPVTLTASTECIDAGALPDQIERIEIDGQGVAAAERPGMVRLIGSGLAEAVGTGELCYAYSAQPDGALTYDVTAEGQAEPEMSDRAIWVSPADGWRVTL